MAAVGGTSAAELRLCAALCGLKIVLMPALYRGAALALGVSSGAAPFLAFIGVLPASASVYSLASTKGLEPRVLGPLVPLTMLLCVALVLLPLSPAAAGVDTRALSAAVAVVAPRPSRGVARAGEGEVSLEDAPPRGRTASGFVLARLAALRWRRRAAPLDDTDEPILRRAHARRRRGRRRRRRPPRAGQREQRIEQLGVRIAAWRRDAAFTSVPSEPLRQHGQQTNASKRSRRQASVISRGDSAPHRCIAVATRTDAPPAAARSGGCALRKQVELAEGKVGPRLDVRQVHRAVDVHHHDVRLRQQKREQQRADAAARAHVEDDGTARALAVAAEHPRGFKVELLRRRVRLGNLLAALSTGQRGGASDRRPAARQAKAR